MDHFDAHTVNPNLDSCLLNRQWLILLPVKPCPCWVAPIRLIPGAIPRETLFFGANPNLVFHRKMTGGSTKNDPKKCYFTNKQSKRTKEKNVICCPHNGSSTGAKHLAQSY